jgi:cold shock CspA family protein/ribosome-associated translation inhibitor RaiA
METPVHIDFPGSEPLEKLRSAVERHVEELEVRFGRITSCRVTVKAPGGRHKTGGLYEIKIHLALPTGRDVHISRTPTQDTRHADVDFAINDAFKHARRLLQDQTGRLKGHVKQHEAPPMGTVRRIEPIDQYGILESANGREIYFHRNSVLNGDFAKLTIGDRVTFAEEMGQKGPQASTVKLSGKHAVRSA